MKTDKPKNHYVDNAALYRGYVEWHRLRKEAEANGDPEPEPLQVITDAIVKIPTHLATKSNFGGYSFRDEMIGDAILNIYTYFRNFDPEKSKNPFSYFTQISHHAFIRRIMLEKKASYIKHKVIMNSGFDDAMELQDHDQGEDYHATVLELLQQNHRPELEELFESRAKKRVKKKAVQKTSIEDFLGDDECESLIG